MTEKTIKIQGMHCQSCAKLIEMTLEDEGGVKSISVSYDEQKAHLEYDPSQIETAAIIQSIEKLGYQAAEEV